MIFARLIYDEHYDYFHKPVVACLLEAFPELEHGHQCDSWIWITEGDEKVEVDTFYSMHHEIRARHDSPLVQAVIAQLQNNFQLEVLAEPEEDPTDGFEPLS